MMKIFNSIRVRLTLWHIGTIGLLILIFASTLYLSLKKTLERSIDIALRTAGEEIEHAFLENPHVSWEQILNEESDKELPISRMYIRISLILRILSRKALFVCYLPCLSMN